MAALALALLTLAAPSEPLAHALRLQVRLDLRVLDVAFLDARRLALLTETALSLHAIDGARLVPVARLALPGEPVRARAAAGLLRPVPGEEACWAISNRRAGATLFTWSGGRLAAIAGADAIPPTALPGSAPLDGARFETGTNRVRLGPLALLRLTASGLGVAPDGTLLRGAEAIEPAFRVGDAIADVGERLLAASAATPPAGTDQVRVFSIADATALVVASWPVTGRVRALAGWAGTELHLLAVAADSPEGTELTVHALGGDR